MSKLAESERLLKIARQAALTVEESLRAAFRSTMEVGFKRDLHDPVTVHDKMTEAALAEFLLREVPDSTLVGEEGGGHGSGRINWYVDPIDGTANFARGLAFWCVSIAAVVDDRPVAGVIFDPIARNLFTASLSGAWLNGDPLCSRAVPRESEATLLTSYPGARDIATDGREQALAHFAELVEAFSTLRRPGSAALSIAHVAAGWADAALGVSLKPWDVSAAILLLEQSGGRYVPLTYGKATPEAAHLCPAHVALGRGADYPTLMAVAEAITAGRRGPPGATLRDGDELAG